MGRIMDTLTEDCEIVQSMGTRVKRGDCRGRGCADSHPNDACAGFAAN
jgi:hypothetical protein